MNADVIGIAAYLLLLAWVCETVIDVVKSRYGLGLVVPKNWNGWFWPCLGGIIGVGIAFGFQVSLAPILAQMGIESAPVWWLDRILAGVIIGGGASTVYDWLDTRGGMGGAP